MPRAGRRVIAALLPLLVLGASPDPAGADPPTTGSTEERTSEETPRSEGASPLRIEEEILVRDVLPRDPAISSIDRDRLEERPHADPVEALRDAPGLSAGRMGGHGLEPRIRGLGEASLNVLIDGAYVHGGCPNRMDPPTSFASAKGFERIVVLRGVQTLRYGGGGSAGTILFERRTPRFARGERWRLDLSTGYGSSSGAPDLALDATLGAPELYFRALAESIDRDDYEDGEGHAVRSAFSRRGANLILGWTPDEAHLLELSFAASRTVDALFAGAGMDSPEDRGNLLRLRFRRRKAPGRVAELAADLYLSRVDHRMDNFSLRPLAAPMAMQALSASDTAGGRLGADLAVSAVLQLAVGLDLQRNERWARRYAGPDPLSVRSLQSVLWPQVRVSQGGVFAEGARALRSGRRVRFGLRADRFSASAGDADVEPASANPSPERLYRTYYGGFETRWSHSDVSGLLRYEQVFSRTGLTLFGGVSRSVRPADVTERYLAANSPLPLLRWVGNPGLAAAKHHQLDLGLVFEGDRTTLTGTAYLDHVDDFILRDRAHGQSGVAPSDGATVYRNVSARLSGFELEMRRRWGENLSFEAQASHVRAENRTDRRPIAQIPPLQGLLRVEAQRGRWRASARLEFALRQTRVDDDPLTGSGLDAGETAGFAVVGFAGSYDLSGGLRLQLGVDNLLDRTYARHLNRGSVFDPEQIRVNEPGRTGWVRLGWSP